MYTLLIHIIQTLSIKSKGLLVRVSKNWLMVGVNSHLLAASNPATMICMKLLIFMELFLPVFASGATEEAYVTVARCRIQCLKKVSLSTLKAWQRSPFQVGLLTQFGGNVSAGCDQFTNGHVTSLIDNVLVDGDQFSRRIQFDLTILLMLT